MTTCGGVVNAMRALLRVGTAAGCVGPLDPDQVGELPAAIRKLRDLLR